MALSYSVNWEVRNDTGSDLNGGGFNAARTGAGTDYTYPVSLPSAISLTADGSAVVTADRPFVAADVGNVIATEDPAHPGHPYYTTRYEIVSVSGGGATLDRAVTANTYVAKLGGALENPGQGSRYMVASNTVWVRSGLYLIANTRDAFGRWHPENMGRNGTSHKLIGYGAVRGDRGGSVGIPILRGAGSQVLVYSDSEHTYVSDIEVDCQGSTQRGIWLANNRSHASRCIVRDFTEVAISAVWIRNCVAIGGSSGCYTAFQGNCISCLSWGFQGNRAFAYGSDGIISDCVAAFATNFGMRLDGQGCHIYRCVAYKCGAGGILGEDDNSYLEGCIAWGNGGGLTFFHTGEWNASGGNTGGDGGTRPTRTILLTQDPFVDGDNGNFALNDLPGGGALLKASSGGAYTGVQKWPSLNTVFPANIDKADIGPLGSGSVIGGGRRRVW